MGPVAGKIGIPVEMGLAVNRRSRTLVRALVVLVATASLLALTCCTKKSTAQISTADLTLRVKTPFRFVAYGDTRFHDPNDSEAANAAARRALVKAIADASP